MYKRACGGKGWKEDDSAFKIAVVNGFMGNPHLISHCLFVSMWQGELVAEERGKKR